MKRVLLVATGDTIAYSCRSGSSEIASGTELLATIPSDALAARVVVADVMAEPSWDTSPATMLGLARRVRAALRDDGFDGVVVTHGIDTLAETAFLTDLLAGPAVARGGIVFTGAVRCRDEVSSDGPRNLASAIAAAADPALRGVGAVVCLNDELHAARWATLTDATQVAAFSSAPYPLLGRVLGGRVLGGRVLGGRVLGGRVLGGSVGMMAVPPARPPQPGGEPESDVALIKTYPGITPMLLTTVVDAGARGIVLEGTGTGNVPVELFTTISELTEWDIPVVIASRSYAPATALEDAYFGAGLAAKIGAIGARGLAPAQARCALMVALGAGGVAAVRQWFTNF